MKIVELTIVKVFESVKDKQTFSTMTFIKNKLLNRLSTHLPLVICMHVQEFYGLYNFSYDVAYDKQKSSNKKEV